MLIRYSLSLTPDDNGTLLVTCPDLPEVTSFGETEEEALAMGQGAVVTAISGRLAAFDDIPRPSEGSNAVALPARLAIKVLLFWAMREEGVTRAELMRRMGEHRTQVDRLFDPNRSIRLEGYEAAFAALGRQISVRVEAA